MHSFFLDVDTAVGPSHRILHYNNAVMQSCAETEESKTRDAEHAHRAHPPLLLVSGGAEGSDEAWSNVVVSHGRRVVVMSFPGHRSKPAQSASVLVRKLKDQDLKCVIPTLSESAVHLGRRSVPREGALTFIHRLLCRNAWIVHKATHCFAVGYKLRTYRSNLCTLSVRVQGGTAWACQMFVCATLRKLKQQQELKQEPKDKQPLLTSSSNSHTFPCNLWLFDQDIGAWNRGVLRRTKKEDGAVAWSFCWEAQSRALSLPKSGRVALVGTRKILTNGCDAIRECCGSLQKRE